MHQLDRFISDLLLPAAAVSPDPDEDYRIRRLRMNFRLDLADLRGTFYRHASKGWFGSRGPHLTGLRQILLRVAIQYQLVISGRPKSTIELWSWLWKLANSQFGYYTHLSNRMNDLLPPVDSECVRYLPEVFFFKHLGTSFNHVSLRDDFRAWLKEDDNHINIFCSALGENIMPRFYTSASAAPHNHRDLPTGVKIGTQAAAEHVVQKLGLPGHESMFIRKQRKGLVAVLIPTSWLLHFGRPTVLEALDRAYFFLAGENAANHGRTWPLTTNMKRNDRHQRFGCVEWAAILDIEKFVVDRVDIVYVGPFS